METPRLAATDLNLLVALDALVAEGSVTRAAERVGLTQPAMSHALSRLRKLFGDPLLVRTPQGMLPTPRAQELIEPVRRALGEIERALSERGSFEPRASRRPFSIATVDFGSLLVVPPLYARLKREAPACDLLVRPLRMDQIEQQLADGEIDVGMGVLYDEDLHGVVRQKLYEERFVCVVRADHPTVGDRVSLEEFVALEHALIAPRGRGNGFVDRALAAMGLSRRVAVTVPHFLAAPILVAQSDLILTVSDRIARIFVGMVPLKIIPTPLPVGSFAVSQFWHERQSKDPAHAWLRAQILDVCRGV